MAEALLPAVAAAAATLAAAGAAKLRSPASALEALAAFGLPRRRLTARLVGAGELCVGVLCLVGPGRAGPALLAAVYLALSLGVGARLRRREGRAPCGCFGAASAEIGVVHLAFNCICLAAAVAALVAPPTPLAAALAHGLGGAVLLVATASSVYLAFAALTLLPGAWQARRSGDVRAG